LGAIHNGSNLKRENVNLLWALTSSFQAGAANSNKQFIKKPANAKGAVAGKKNLRAFKKR
jgi:hypothetical protein